MKKILFILLVCALSVNAEDIRTFYSRGANGIFRSGDPVEFTILLDKDKSAECQGSLAVRNIYNNEILKKSFTVDTGKARKLTLNQWNHNGFFAVTADFGGKKKECSFVVTPFMKKRDPHFCVRPMGYNEFFECYRRLGFGALNGFCFTPTYFDGVPLDKLREEILKSAYAKRAKLQLASDFEVYVHISTMPTSKTKWEKMADGNKRKLAENLYDMKRHAPSEDFYKRYEIYAKTLAGLGKGKVFRYTIVDEADSRSNADRHRIFESGLAYLAMHVMQARVIYDAIKEVEPNAVVSLCSSSGRDYHTTKPPFALTRMILRDMHGKFDAIGLDAYNGNYSLQGGRTKLDPPENGLRRHLIDAGLLAKEFGKDGTVTMDERQWIPSNGLPLLCKNTLLLANFHAREQIIVKSVKHVPYYVYLDYCTDGLDSDLCMFQAHKDEKGKIVYNPFPCAIGFATAARMLSFATPLRKSEITLPYEVYAYMFNKDGKLLVPAWTAAGKQLDLEVVFPNDYEITDIQGNTEKHKAGKQLLKLSGAPVFISVDAKAADIRKMFESGKFLNTNDIYTEVRQAAPGKALLLIRNLSGKQCTATAGNTDIKLKPNEAKVTEVAAPDGKLTVKCNKTSLKLVVPSDALKIAEAPAEMKIDGSLDKYGKATSVRLTSPKDIFPRSATTREVGTLQFDGKDIEVDLSLAWDKANLYLAAKVRDRLHVNSSQGSKLWQGDNIQIGIAPYNRAWSKEAEMKEKLLNVSIALAEGKVQAFDYMSDKQASFECSVKRDGEYTFYEAAIPWSFIGMKNVAPGSVFGMALAFFDLNSTAKGAVADHWAGFGEGLAGEADPSKYKTCILE